MSLNCIEPGAQHNYILKACFCKYCTRLGEIFHLVNFPANKLVARIFTKNKPKESMNAARECLSKGVNTYLWDLFDNIYPAVA